LSRWTTFSAGVKRKILSLDEASLLVGLDPCVLLAHVLPRAGTIPPAERRASSSLVDALERGRLRCVTSTMALAETTYVAGRERIPFEARRDLLSYLTFDLSASLTFVPVTQELAVAAAEFRLLHYHRDRAPISYADALFAVTAWDAGANRLVTFDAPLLALGDPRIVPPSGLSLS
jgi:predicted nucleic acid-binding protein